MAHQQYQYPPSTVSAQAPTHSRLSLPSLVPPLKLTFKKKATAQEEASLGTARRLARVAVKHLNDHKKKYIISAAGFAVTSAVGVGVGVASIEIDALIHPPQVSYSLCVSLDSPPLIVLARYYNIDRHRDHHQTVARIDW